MASGMPTSTASLVTQRPRTPPNVPKLTYRKVTPNRSSDFAPGAISSKSTPSLASTLAPSSSVVANHGSNPKANGLASGTAYLEGSTKPERTVASSDTPTQSKKKNLSIFGFLKAKEPSTQAWLDYQDSLRKQQQAQHGRVSAVGMPMVSSAKLPPTVPKVNSKWDGVPDSIAQREKERKAAKQDAHRAQAKLMMDGMTGGASVRSRSSSRSTGSRKVVHSTQHSVTSLFGEPQGSCSSAASSRPDLPWSSASVTESDRSPSIFGSALNSGPQTPLSDISAFVPSLPEAMKLPEEPSKMLLTMGFEVPEVLKLTASPTTSVNKPLPMTPQHSVALHATASATPNANPKRPVLDRHATIPSVPSLEFVPLRSSGATVLAPPISAQRKNKASPCSAWDVGCSQSPPSQPASILKKDATPRNIQVPTRPLFSAYFASSQPPPNRTESTKNHTIAHWDSRDDKSAQLSRKEAERSITPTPRSTSGASRTGRMSFFRS